MKNYFLILVFLLLNFSCASKQDDPLIIPPNFSEMPDLNNPEKTTSDSSKENVERLKDMLLKSD